MTKPKTEGPVGEKPDELPVSNDPTDAIMAATLATVEEQGNVALLNLRGAVEEAERALTQMQVRVELGQMGAESIPPLTAAIAEAKQVESDLKEEIKKAQKQRLETQEVG